MKKKILITNIVISILLVLYVFFISIKNIRKLSTEKTVMSLERKLTEENISSSALQEIQTAKATVLYNERIGNEAENKYTSISLLACFFLLVNNILLLLLKEK